MKNMPTNNLLAELADATANLLGEGTEGAALQKRQQSNFKRALVLGAPALLAAATGFAAEPGEWDIDSAVLFYGETDRVQAFEPVISGTRQFDGEKTLNAKLVVDVLTGASPNGAVPSDQAQTYTRPSGNGSYTTNAGETPLDDTFRDTRLAVSGGWKQPLTESMDGNVSASISNEYDYLSLGINGGLSYDFNQNNSQLSFGLSYATDSIDPEGGVPLAGSCLFGASASTGCTETSFDETRVDGTESKNTIDLLFGYTQVLGKNTVAQFNLGLSQSDGYHNDPFKVVSVVGNNGEPLRHIHESRPDNRLKQSLFSRVKHYVFNRDVIDASYRLQTDDYGLTSHTLDFRYRWAFNDNQTLTPHVRYYTQSAVDFYQPFLRDGGATPEFYTADYRQGAFDGITIGLEYGYQFNENKEMRVALELYQQAGDNPNDAPGQLANKEIYPDLDAVMLRVNYDFDW
jgi:hypothetical protein